MLLRAAWYTLRYYLRCCKAFQFLEITCASANVLLRIIKLAMIETRGLREFALGRIGK